ncbi:hypothetical protein J5N97_022456 [Dioscorea zingiberensis]|uniref:Uncharacterized protein n=1 Tax=Dioscorea zingiberensis TaxID=325984 RepID=A0A9D5CAZ4_9LILI|nr:hypothetical protein J5N97_022456 [Dioscorea zingiberensis]
MPLGVMGVKHFTKPMKGGSLSNKYPEEAEKIFEDMAGNEAYWSTRDKQVKLVGSVEGPPSIDTSPAEKLDTLSKQMDGLTAGCAPHVGSSSVPVAVMFCTTCGGGHELSNCPISCAETSPMEQVKYMGNQQRMPNNQYRPQNPMWNNPAFHMGTPKRDNIHPLKDPVSFVVPCMLGEGVVKKTLADSGASINVMPYKLCMQLGLATPKPTGMTLQLADRSVRRPKGLAEDVLIQINQFVFPADFVLLDVDDNVDIPIILGRPFFATAQALEDHAHGRLALRVGDQEVVFKLPEAMRHTMDHDDISYSVDEVYKITTDCLEDFLHTDPSFQCLGELDKQHEELMNVSTTSTQPPKLS